LEFYTCQPYNSHFTLTPLDDVRCLRDAGFEIYDLGGRDSSPMMSYKAYVSDVLERAAFVDMVRWDFGAKAPEPLNPKP